MCVHCDWSALPPPVLDNLAAVLKRFRRWRSDGPSLRQVNKHWSSAMDINVQEIRPHPSRKICEADVASLLKFLHLTSVDISPFLDFRMNEGSTCAALTQNLYARKLKRVVDVLVQLRHLRDIELHCLTIFRAFSGNGESLKLFFKLTTVTSLCIYGSVNPKLYSDDPLIPPAANQGDALCSARKLEDFISGFPKLKSLETYGSFVSEQISVPRFFDKLESAKLCGLNTVRWIRKGRRTTSFLTSFNLFSPTTHELHVLPSMTRLEVLSLSVSDAMTLTDASVIGILGRLKNLTVKNTSGSLMGIPNSLCDAFQNVHRLSLTRFEFCGKDMKGRLINVEALKLAECRITDCDLSFLAEAQRLQTLSLKQGRHGNINELDAVANAKNLRQLKSLFIGPIRDAYTVKGIAQLSNLEILGLCIHSEMALLGLRELDELSNLRVLGLSHCLDEDLFPALLSLDLLRRLEKLFLDQICFCHMRCECDLERRAPRLILEDKRVDFHRFAASNFF